MTGTEQHRRQLTTDCASWRLAPVVAAARGTEVTAEAERHGPRRPPSPAVREDDGLSLVLVDRVESGQRAAASLPADQDGNRIEQRRPGAIGLAE